MRADFTHAVTKILDTILGKLGWFQKVKLRKMIVNESHAAGA